MAQATRNYSTKKLARELGIERAALLATLRDNRVNLDWNEGTRTWEIVAKHDVEVTIDYYTN